MKLKKEIWQKVKIEEVVTELKAGFSSGKFELDSGEIAHLRTMNISEECQLVWNLTKYITREVFEQNDSLQLKKGDVLFNNTNSTELVGKSCYVHEDLECGFSNHITRVRVDSTMLNSYFLFVIFGAYFKNRLFESYCQKWVGQSGINRGILSKIEIPLPPISEQKQIVSLFQSIESAMEHLEGQEKNLKALWKRLINEFVGDKPSFGKLMKGKKLKTYSYCDVTQKIMRKIDPLTYGIERIVAGENLESEDFKIRTWQNIGEGYLGPAFHVLFKKGDILYGSRRTYLKKVSLADFDGVCSNTTYVIKANENLLLQDLLKHIMLSEKFTQYSIGVSKGSTNPYINWKDLDNFTFQLPDIDTQKTIALVLDDIWAIIEQLKTQKQTLKNLKQKLLNEILGYNL